MKDRTPVFIVDHIQAVIDHLESVLSILSYPVPIGFGERPVSVSKAFVDPPYLIVTYLPGGFTQGPLDDTQADIVLRVLLVSNGNTAHEASVLRDICHGEMQASNLTVTNRKVRDVRVEGFTDGIFRDDDVPTPIFYTRQVYLMDTVPA